MEKSTVTPKGKEKVVEFSKELKENSSGSKFEEETAEETESQDNNEESGAIAIWCANHKNLSSIGSEATLTDEKEQAEEEGFANSRQKKKGKKAKKSAFSAKSFDSETTMSGEASPLSKRTSRAVIEERVEAEAKAKEEGDAYVKVLVDAKAQAKAGAKKKLDAQALSKKEIIDRAKQEVSAVVE
ncbi:tol-Pal system protein TolA-like [Rhodamnia argentea]|uniref:Tol-Pal system protein TolA-like n=1 Tax=Rhodamnia argentea TaxID=178133 RepID=A0A8B8PJW5_9MYRT|nr:tol-Pal system protein TolA-like [Rhodamnia argentea]